MHLSSNKGFFAALLAVFIWGAFPILLKGTLYEFNEIEQLLTLRFFISTLLLAPILPRALNKLRHVELHLILAFTLITVTVFYSQTYALNQVPASWYVAAFTFVPVVFLVFSRQTLNTFEKMGSAIAMAGMLFFFASLSHDAQMSVSSIVLLVVSILSWVAYSLLTKKLHSRLQDYELVALTCFVGLLASLFFWGLNGFHVQAISIIGLGLCAFTSIAVLIALVAYSFSLRKSPVFAVFAQYLEPVFGLTLAALFMSEKMVFLQYLSVSLVVIGTFLVGFASKKNAT